MFLTYISGRNNILDFFLFDCTKAHLFSHIYYFRKQQGAFIGTKETESEHSRTMVEVGEVGVSVQAVDTGMCSGYLQLRFMVVQIFFFHF